MDFKNEYTNNQTNLIHNNQYWKTNQMLIDEWINEI